MIVPDARDWHPPLHAWLNTGRCAVDAVRSMPTGAVVAIDSETPSVTDSFTIKAFTAAWQAAGHTESVLLDPLRRPDDLIAAQEVCSRASTLVLQNCFSGDTEVITRAGVRRFEDMAGETVEVWSANAWRKARARCYGLGSTRRIELVPARYRTNVSHSIEATGNHRWPLMDGRLVFTDDLRPGDVIQASKVITNIDHTTDAFKHGMIFADGSLYTNQPVAEGVWGYQMRLCGAKAQWSHLFTKMTYPPSGNGDPVVTGRLPFNPKALPENPDADYIANFIEGWQLLDGTDYGRNRQVSTISKEAADWLQTHAATGGWYVTGRSTHVTKGGYKPGSVSYIVTLSRGGGSKPVCWRVKAISALSYPKPVYCVEVPKIERFTLAQGIYTGNSPFDIPGLVAGKIMGLDDCAKVLDTLIYARSAWPDQIVGKSLEDLAKRVLHAEVLPGGLALAIKAAGYRSRSDWFARADIDVPMYRFGAMADTVMTLRLLAPMRRIASDHQLNHPFESRASTTRDEADALVHRAQRVNQISLRRAARGYVVDLSYLDTYRDTVDVDIARQSTVLSDAGIRPGNGGDLMAKMDELGLVPPAWPRTEKTNKLSAAKEDIELLDHPLADAHRAVAHGNKILGYLEKTVARSAITGRLHPQINILGASATGRMSISEPELQQFPKEARPIILEDFPGAGVTSVDWSSIEPAILAWAANDLGFITPFERGADLYAPIMSSCGIERDPSKTVLLAQIYGQGLWKMALKIKKSEDEAKRIKADMFAAMPGCELFIGKLKAIAEQHRMVPTLGGRILPVPLVFDKRSGKKKVASYKAVNYFCQGSNADLVYRTILTADAEGWADRILFAMHDELIGDTEVGPEMERVMQSPPEYFTRWTDHTPVIRTDRHDVGSAWQKC